MSKPEWCPQDVWDIAQETTKAWPGNKPIGELVARSILSAEQRGALREREAIQAMLAPEAPHSPRRYIYDNGPDRRIWACDKLDHAIRNRQETDHD